MNYHIKTENATRRSIKFLISLGLILVVVRALHSSPLLADLLPSAALSKGTDPKSKSLEYFAFGDVRGEIEPCGCDPLTDLGGFKRVAYFAKQNPKAAIFSLGNLYPVNSNNFKEELINASLSTLKITAALPNEIELTMLKSKRLIDISRTPYVLSNVSAPIPKFLRSSIETPNIVIFGYVSPSNHSGVSLTLEPYTKVKATWISKLGKNKKYKVLLFSGNDSDLKDIQKDKLFDEVISSNPKPLTATPNHEEKDKPGLLLRQDGIYMVPSFGQGLLLGGSLRSKYSDKKPPSIFSDRKPVKDQEKKLDFSFGEDKIFLWLTKEYEDAKSLAQIFKTYNDRVAKAYKLLAKQRTTELAETKFAGAEACQSCHPSAFKVWEKSSHAYAFATLKKKIKHQDPECISCHVLGLNEKGGFVNETVTPHFANVQCETCHGPGKEHAANPSVKPRGLKPAKDICVSCHHQPHSTQFNFETYWPKIKHER